MARGWHSWTRTLLLGTTATPADALAHPLTLASTTRHFYPLAPVNHRRWARLWVRRHQHDTSDRRVPADPPRIADATPNPALVDLDASLSSTATSTTDAIAFLLRSTLTALHRPRPLLHAAQDSLPDQVSPPPSPSRTPSLPPHNTHDEPELRNSFILTGTSCMSSALSLPSFFPRGREDPVRSLRSFGGRGRGGGAGR
ncbi:hypothetical protein AAT19DRAFT_12609 [Rhodotorula toruloides]|uniref:Uncharacterized protein n=1 Tax=Rhodotorula toruloides TaxID=5286 RepID=A0A2T0AGP7_RHOTO|nr:hypothetical protein AAT19DRAFT_12609 [Rhodotorula toruloides]